MQARQEEVAAQAELLTQENVVILDSDEEVADPNQVLEEDSHRPDRNARGDSTVNPERGNRSNVRRTHNNAAEGSGLSSSPLTRLLKVVETPRLIPVFNHFLENLEIIDIATTLEN